MLEIVAFTADEVRKLEDWGVPRVVIMHHGEGVGLTPDSELVERALLYDIDVAVTLRPAGGNFVYSKEEKRKVLRQIEDLKKMGVKEIIFGCLDENKDIDWEFLVLVLAKINKDMNVTFNWACDWMNDYEDNLERLAEFKINRVLTAGRAETCMEGAKTIREKTSGARRHQMKIVAGRGITHSNVVDVLEKTKCDEIHVWKGARDQKGNLKKEKIDELVAIKSNPFL